MNGRDIARDGETLDRLSTQINQDVRPTDHVAFGSAVVTGDITVAAGKNVNGRDPVEVAYISEVVGSLEELVEELESTVGQDVKAGSNVGFANLTIPGDLTIGDGSGLMNGHDLAAIGALVHTTEYVSHQSPGRIAGIKTFGADILAGGASLTIGTVAAPFRKLHLGLPAEAPSTEVGDIRLGHGILGENCADLCLNSRGREPAARGLRRQLDRLGRAERLAVGGRYDVLGDAVGRVRCSGRAPRRPGLERIIQCRPRRARKRVLARQVNHFF